MTDKLQVHTVTPKVDLKSNRHAKTFFDATTLKFIAAHMSARLNWETFYSAAKFTRQRFVALTKDWKNITKKLATCIPFFSLSVNQ